MDFLKRWNHYSFWVRTVTPRNYCYVKDILQPSYFSTDSGFWYFFYKKTLDVFSNGGASLFMNILFIRMNTGLSCCLYYCTNQSKYGHELIQVLLPNLLIFLCWVCPPPPNLTSSFASTLPLLLKRKIALYINNAKIRKCQILLIFLTL